MGTIKEEGRVIRERARAWFLAYLGIYKEVYGANDSRFADLFGIGNSTLTGYKTPGGSFGADALFFLRRRFKANINRIIDRDITDDDRDGIRSGMEADFAEKHVAAGHTQGRRRRPAASGA